LRNTSKEKRNAISKKGREKRASKRGVCFGDWDVKNAQAEAGENSWYDVQKGGGERTRRRMRGIGVSTKNKKKWVKGE